MRTEISHNYHVTLYPDDYDDDYLTFVLTTENFSDTSVEFCVIDSKQYAAKYVGRLPDGIWYIDPDFKKGTMIDFPISYSKIEEEMEEIDDYDEEECYILAKAVELICADIFRITIKEDERDLPF